MRPSSSLGSLGRPKRFSQNSHQLSPPPEMVISRFALCTFPTAMVKTHDSLQEKFHGRKMTVCQKHSV